MVEGLNFIQDGTTLPTAGESEDFNEPGQSPYWAADIDPLIVTGRVFDRATQREREFERSTLFNKMLRSLKYYYGFFDDGEDFGDTAITLTGQEGQILNFTLNYYRYLIRQLLTLITSEELNYKVNPANIDAKSLVQSRLGKRILEFYRTNRDLDQLFRDALEQALVFGISFIKVTWDTSLGSMLDADVDKNIFIHEGDVDVSLIDFTDLTFEVDGHENWKDVHWVDYRERVNKYDLMAQFPSQMQAIDAFSLEKDPRLDPDPQGLITESDDIFVHTFIHKPSDAIPKGRLIYYFEETILKDLANPYGCIPVYPMKLGVVRRTQLGWTPAFDVQKQNELLNELLGKVATIYDTLGLPLIWGKTGVKIAEPSMFVGNIAMVEADEPPVVVDLVKLPDSIFNAIEMIKNDMETVIGINSIVQGGTAGSVRANRMQLFAQAQSIRFNSNIEFAYTQTFEEVGGAILKALQTFPEQKALRTLIGTQERDSLISFVPDDLIDITSVTVDRGNPILKTVEGRLEVLSILQQSNVPLPNEAVVAVLSGAPLDVLTQTVEGQVEIAAAENEALMQGGQHLALITDDHLFHVKKHAAVLNSAEARSDPELTRGVLSAIMQHLELYNDPSSFEYQMALGYADPNVPPLGMRGPQAEAGAQAATVGQQVTQQKAAQAPAGPPQNGTQAPAEAPLPAAV